MSFALHEVTAIARELASDYEPAIEIVAVMPSEGNADSAELIVAPQCGDLTLIGIHVSRAGSREEVRAAIACALRRRFGRAEPTPAG